jgi:iron(III) transport system substrate-binding protein
MTAPAAFGELKTGKAQLMTWTKRTARLWLCGGSSVAAFLFAAGAMAAGPQKVTVYTALQAEQLPVYEKAFEAKYPKFQIDWVRGTPAEITAKLLAEKADPQADVIWGLGASYLMEADKSGQLEHYRPAGFDQVKDDFKDRRTGWPVWVGMDAWANAICFNPKVAADRKIPKPNAWKDLVEPAYKGQIVMPNPTASDTGFLSVAGWIQTFGETGGWDFMDLLHENVSSYLYSGAKSCAAVATGDAAIGISFGYAGVKLGNNGSPVEVIFPKEGLGWEMEATAVVKGAKHLQGAQAVADFSASAEANALYNSYYQILARKDVAVTLPDNYPAGEEEALVSPNDFSAIAARRQAILDEWEKRYSGKNAPKS